MSYYPSLKIKRLVANLSFSSGCYLYKNINDQVIYVGKAKIIKKRVKSYFENWEKLDPKIKIMVKQIFKIEVVETESELEAILLETNLIKKYRPKYNKLMKDDKSYVWLEIENKLDFPKIQVVHQKNKKKAIYLGPFHRTVPVKKLLRMLRKVFPYRTCNRKIVETTQKNGTKVIKSSDPKPCLYYYIGLCQAPCAGKINKKEYQKSIVNIKKFFNKKIDLLEQDIKNKMDKASKQKKYELASIYRDQINDLKQINHNITISEKTDEFSFANEKISKNKLALQELINRIDIANLKYQSDFKIECYDISNISGKYAVGSMVVFVNGSSKKSLYRKFRIKTKDTPDDFAMMSEVLQRRLKRLTDEKDTSFHTLPDLIIIDGGKGQLSSAINILLKNKSFIPTIGLAKRNEEIFVPSEQEGELKFIKKTLKAGSDAKFLIQRIRDESHRFAITYHRNLRSKAQLSSSLNSIPGIGESTLKKLFIAFGSLEGIAKASSKELNEVVKNKTIVSKLINHFKA